MIGHGVEERLAGALEEAHGEHDPELAGQAAEPRDDRVALRRPGQVEVPRVLRDGEVRRREELLQQDDLRASPGRFADQPLGRVQIGRDVPAAGELRRRQRHLARHRDLLVVATVYPARSRSARRRSASRDGAGRQRTARTSSVSHGSPALRASMAASTAWCRRLLSGISQQNTAPGTSHTAAPTDISSRMPHMAVAVCSTSALVAHQLEDEAGQPHHERRRGRLREGDDAVVHAFASLPREQLVHVRDVGEHRPAGDRDGHAAGAAEDDRGPEEHDVLGAGEQEQALDRRPGEREDDVRGALAVALAHPVHQGQPRHADEEPGQHHEARVVLRVAHPVHGEVDRRRRR